MSRALGMGAKVQFDNYYSMRDLNHDSNGTSWSLHHIENNLPNGQYHYNVLPRATPDLSSGVDKELLKQKMLEHEAVFRSQVFELHRLYRVQKDLMDEIQKKEQFKHRTPLEVSSSSSPFPSQMTPEDAHRRNSSNFLFANGGCGGPPVSHHENIQSSADGSIKGKSAHCGPILSQNCASPKNSEVSESRPSKLRKMIDLERPADEYMDGDEIEQCGNGMTNDSGDKSFSSRCENTKPGIADLNEPLESEETHYFQNQDLLTKVPGVSEVVSLKPEQGNIDGARNNSHYNDKGSGQNWYLSASKPEGSRDNGKAYYRINHYEKAHLTSRSEQVVFENRHQPPGIFQPHHVKEDPCPAKANDSWKTLDKSRSLSGFNNLEGLVASHLPSHGPYSNLVNSWENSWRKPSNYLNHKSTSVHTTPFDSAGLAKNSQSSAPSNGFLEPWWCRNDKLRSNPGLGSETSVRNGFYHGSSSGGYKDLPASFSKAGPDYVTGSSNDKAVSGSSNFLKGINSIDLNSTRDLNLNVSDGEPDREDYVSVLPWLGAKASNNEVARSRNSPNKPESSPLQDRIELHNGCEIRNALDHHNSTASTSCNVDAARRMGYIASDYPSNAKRILGVPVSEAPLSEEREVERGKKRALLDINVPYNDPEEFDNVEDNRENVCPNGLRNMIDLNLCVMEDEFLSRTSQSNNSSTTANSMNKPERGIIDLEAPVDLEAEEDDNCIPGEEIPLNPHQLPLDSPLQDSTDRSDENLARVAAEAIMALSIYSPENCVDDSVTPNPPGETHASEDALSWFVDIACSFPDEVVSLSDDDEDRVSSDSDSFEEMTLKLAECTIEEYFPNPPNFDSLIEETGPVNVTGRARRGPTRRGRQRRDFQRDILPGLTSLARQEVTEDLQTFGGLMRATGHAWHCGSRRNSSRGGSGRGRRRAVAAVPPPSPPPPPPPPAALPPAVSATPGTPRKQLPKNGEIMLEDRSLTSWGKTTRRPRRQRCPPAAAGNPAPIPLA